MGTEVATASTAATTYSLVASDANLTRLVTCIELSHSGGAGAGAVTIALVNPVTSNAVQVVNLNLANTGRQSMFELFGVLTIELVVPPNTQLRVSFPATAAGETYGGRVFVGTMRAGVKPI